MAKSTATAVTLEQMNSALATQKEELLAEFSKMLSAIKECPSSDDEASAKGKKGRAKKVKKAKDPDAPKKPLTGFMLYAKNTREAVKKENPDIKPTEVMKKIGEMWGALSDEEKASYKAQ
jgi:hypothetical protein